MAKRTPFSAAFFEWSIQKEALRLMKKFPLLREGRSQIPQFASQKA
jgi:hypothetical protein